ncbi:hypothetical protein EX30DRAFT_144915 [Ascodesmis nigricans]|uniref:Uncharacterized protein n=1 Tax=Ascodesmis nigricans TaxID=341454 RepID=A0A4S2N1N6_9PEZI|nr:hypothetical protein EX30DRAFT_144915 [Ascodesmis nigricans]
MRIRYRKLQSHCNDTSYFMYVEYESILLKGKMAERSKAPHSSSSRTYHIQCGLRSRKRRGFKSHSCQYSFVTSLKNQAAGMCCCQSVFFHHHTKFEKFRYCKLTKHSSNPRSSIIHSISSSLYVQRMSVTVAGFICLIHQLVIFLTLLVPPKVVPRLYRHSHWRIVTTFARLCGDSVSVSPLKCAA